jgi:hypothetical protein
MRVRARELVRKACAGQQFGSKGIPSIGPSGQWTTKMDEYERRSRLVSLAYEVLRDMKTPADEATNMAMSSDLSRAFLDKATALANLEPGAPTARALKLPASMYSIADVRTSVRGRAH